MFEMNHMANGMMLGMGFMGVLSVVALVLVIAALTKYVFFGSRG